MEVTKFDALGRLTLPLEMAAQLGLCESSRLLMTVQETEKRLILRPTREMLPIATVAEMERMQAAMLRQPAGMWRYIRALDDRRRFILPRSMREWLGWSEKTRLQIGLVDGMLYAQEAERGDPALIVLETTGSAD